MIKLNLLPQYVIEFRRIRVVIIAFVVVLVAQAGVVLKAYTDLRNQATWFDSRKAVFIERKAKIEAQKEAANKMKTKAVVYAPYIDFFSRKPVIERSQKILETLTEAAKMVGGGPQWYDDMVIEKNNVTLNGRIPGLMNFVNFYFRMKDNGFTVEPAAQPAASDAPAVVWGTMTQMVPLKVTGTLQSSLPETISAPGTPSTPEQLYAPAGAKAEGTAGAASTPASGGGPGAPAGGPSIPTGGPGAPPGGAPGGPPGGMTGSPGGPPPGGAMGAPGSPPPGPPAR